MTTALLVSTYNWPAALGLIFKSLEAQTRLPDEILIADDGSATETVALIQEFASGFKIPVKHFWHEDRGFRKSKILNKAIAGTNCDYIIQIDGDIIMHPGFIADHITLAQKNVYLYGSRINILPKSVTTVLEKKRIRFGLFSPHIKNKGRVFHLPFVAKMQRPHQGHSSKFRGCNVSFWRSDFIRINGYNEAFEGWGREDSDLVIRLGNLGVLAKRLKYAGIGYHIYHPVKSKENLEKNDLIQKQTITAKVTRIEDGIDKYLPAE